jgi:chemotaxis protein methyltransferase CheR
MLTPTRLSEADFDFVSKYIYARSAIVLEKGKEYLVESRLGPIAKALGMESLSELVQKLRMRPDPQLEESVVEAMTTNETLFFRDRHPFETLVEETLPRLIEARRAERKLNIWCAATSSGQEPYSVLILLKEHFPELASWDINFLGSDISQAMLDRTRAGIYSQLEINRGMPARLMVKYFEKDGATWQIKKELRDMLQLRRINLAESWGPMPRLDLVFIRNVLIYFDTETKKKILGCIRRQMRADGVMFLGGSETTVNLDSSFQRVRQGETWVYQAAA